MKIFLTPIISRGRAVLAAAALVSPAMGVVPAGAQETKQSLKQTYQQAKSAFHRGDYITARKGFATILRHNPRHTYSRNYMAQILLYEKERGGNPSLERKMNSLVLDEVSMDELTLEEAIEYLVLKAREMTNGEFKPNIILKGLGPAEKEKKHSIQLSKVPMGYTLKTLGDLSGVKFVYEKHAIVGAPRIRSEAAGTTAEQKNSN